MMPLAIVCLSRTIPCCCQILEESDIDRGGTINFQEFQHVVARCPEFAQSFSFELV